jgi:hypothetical protein
MKIAIGGGGGFIGQNLAKHLLDQGHRVVILDRNRSRITTPHLESFVVNLLQPELFKAAWFEGVDAVINLSGKDIFTFWNEAAKKAIWESRIKVNRNLIDQDFLFLPLQSDITGTGEKKSFRKMKNPARGFWLRYAKHGKQKQGRPRNWA